MYIASLLMRDRGASAPFRNYTDALNWLEPMRADRDADITIWDSETGEYIADMVHVPSGTDIRKRLPVKKKKKKMIE